MQALQFFVYYSHQKISHLYRQLPESRLIAQRASLNQHDRAECGLRTPHREDEKCLHMTHAGMEGSHSHYREALFEKNDMYQLEQVLCCLRGAGQLHTVPEKLCQGDYLEIQGCFSPERERDTPGGSIWLVSPGGEPCPAIHLLCGRQAFCGETEEAWRELWACGEALPLHGVMLCLAFHRDYLCGVPLFLAV